MNGPMKMYRTKQIIQHNIPVKLPECMYKLKNIHSRSANGVVVGSHDHVGSPNKKVDISDQVKQFLKNNQNIPGMAELEAKQEEILKQLDELKNQIISIKLSLKIPNNASAIPSVPPSTISTKITSEKTKELVDLVINVNPSNPPYSLEIIQKHLQEDVNLKFSAHLHSSVPSLPKDASDLQSRLINADLKTGVPTVNLRLIWKNIQNNLELLVSHTPIIGEVNLLRYLVRAAASSLDYNGDADSIEIDSLLDICYLIVRSKTKTERSALLQSLNKSLGNSQWLGGRSKANVADIAAYSAIQQTVSSKELGVNLSKWFQRCEALN